MANGSAAAAAFFMRRMRPLLGTFVEVTGSGPQAVPAIERAFAAIEQVQRSLSFQRVDSELSRLNASVGHWCQLSPLAIRVLRLARAMTEASDHYFNCTVGGELINRGKLPNHGGDFLASGVAADLELAAGRARLRRPVRITLDGIAKGYAVDCAIAALKHSGLSAGWVNAGGDLRVFGNCDLPVEQRAPDGQLRPLGALRNGALASSQWGAAEQLAGLVVSGRGEGSIEPTVFSVIARFAWRADALTKVAATAPPAEREQWVRRLGGLLVAN